MIGEEGQGSLFISERKRVNMDISDVRDMESTVSKICNHASASIAGRFVRECSMTLGVELKCLDA